LSDMYNVSYAPHITSNYSTRNIMQDVAIALIPASLFGIYNFGLRALMILMISVLTCVMTEYLFLKFSKKPITKSDYSEVVTGMLIALNLSANSPLWLPVIGGVFAIWVVKMLYGGIGQNFMNPAMAARCFLLISFPTRMANYAIESIGANTNLINKMYYGAISVDSISGATPLAGLKAGESIKLFDMFIGNINGTIGETSALAILIGASYLIYRKIITLRIPLSYLVSFAVFIAVFGSKGMDLNFIFAHILGGGLLLAAFFMATDYSTSPITPNGKVIYGILLGILSGVFRVYGASPEGTSYVIIIGNMLVPFIEKISLPKPFGKEKIKDVE